jgi:hypothetical protein
VCGSQNSSMWQCLPNVGHVGDCCICWVFAPEKVWLHGLVAMHQALLLSDCGRCDGAPWFDERQCLLHCTKEPGTVCFGSCWHSMFWQLVAKGECVC